MLCVLPFVRFLQLFFTSAFQQIRMIWVFIFRRLDSFGPCYPWATRRARLAARLALGAPLAERLASGINLEITFWYQLGIEEHRQPRWRIKRNISQSDQTGKGFLLIRQLGAPVLRNLWFCLNQTMIFEITRRRNSGSHMAVPTD